MKQIDFEGTTHQFPEDFSDADISSALGVKGAPAAKPESTATRLYKKVAEPTTQLMQNVVESTPALGAPIAALRGVGVLTGNQGYGNAAETLSRQGAEMAVPQTPLQAAAMLGTGGGSALARVLPMGGRLGGAIARTAGGMAGGEAGGALEGRPAGEGALWGGGPVAALETAAPALGKLLRSAPGAKGRIAGNDAAGYGQFVESVSPPLAGVRTADEIRGVAQGPGQAALGQAKSAANTGIQQGMTAGGNALIDVPALGGGTQTFMTLQDANDAMSHIGARAFSKNPLDRTINGVDQRQLYGQVYDQIIAGLQHADPTGGLAQRFEQAQGAYKAGLSLLRPVQAAGAYRNAPSGAQLNTPFLQDWVSDPKKAAVLRNKLGDQGFEQLVNVLTRGGGQGTRDFLAPGTGRMSDAFMQSIGRGANTGAMQYLGVPFRTLLPNFGSQYAGQAPYSATPGMQTLLDLLGQKAALPGAPQQ